ncbi:MAG TPA: hypothetical protein VM554_11305 [Acidisarcina sp.]|nr:hypothetical protein [Acidisarcina sp.]
MTTEQNEPQAPLAQGQAPQGQAQGHRRRRRRRKGQSGSNPAKSQSAPQANGSSPQASRPHPANQGQKPKSQGRFFQKKSNPGQGQNNANPGNGQGSRRKSKPRRQQVFVGPMDHSYRTVNGNLADGPPSTIELRNGNGNGNGSYYTESAPALPPAVIREDAPTRIFCFIDDLFFLAKIQETARKLGVKVGFVKAEKDIVARLSDTPEDERPSLIIFDLNNANAKPLSLIPKFKSKLKKGTSVIGFLSHLQSDLKAKAIEAGCDTVMPRSAFSQNLPNLLRRHGLTEELEVAEA